MRLLLDTHLLLWAVGVSGRLPAPARKLLDDSENELLFSSASLWEIAIKSGTRRDDFDVDVRLVRRTLLNSLYVELPVTGEHAVAVADLPSLHRDPFDRLLVAQSIVEGITLLTADRIVARYPGRIQRV
jgi:PIN domain nuclease of toxin-antitoxin system